MDCYAELINNLTNSDSKIISKKNVKFIVLDKIKDEFLFTFKSLRFFIEEIHLSNLNFNEKEIKINKRKELIFGNLNFINSLLKLSLIPAKTVFNFAWISLEKFVNAKAFSDNDYISDIYLDFCKNLGII